MGLFTTLRNLVQDPRLKGLDPDSDELLVVHSRILYEKPMMRQVFGEFYDACLNLDKKYFSGTGDRIEIGAGVSFFKKQYPEIVATDIKKADNLDMVVNALDMPFAANTIRAIYGINCFHHFPDPEKFFNELSRVLVKGGGCVLIEPYYGVVAKRFYKGIFDSEGFDATQPGWRNDSLGYMMGANQALSYIVFVRDRAKFEAKFPDLEIVLHRPLNNYMRYLLSGGLNFRQLLPSPFSPLIKLVETLLIPVRSVVALHHVIVIRKR